MSTFRRAKTPPTATTGDGVVGPVRFARQESDFAALRAGDVAVVDLADLDARQAQELIAARVSVVLNAAPSSTGRAPNQGPALLSRAGIRLIDVGDDRVWSSLRNGDVVEISGGRVLQDGTLIASGVEFDEAHVQTTLRAAKDGLATRLDSLTANATDHIHREQAMLLDGARVPRLRSRVRRRPVVVVSKSYDAEADLRGLKRFIAQSDPLLVGAGPGADLLLANGYTPDVLVGELDHLSDRAIQECGEVVVTTATGRVSRPERLERHGKDVVTFTSTGSDDDLAILLADTNEASVVVHVGAPPTLTDLLERAPSEVAGTFVARLRAGRKIVDAKSVPQLTTRPMSLWPLVLLLVCGVVAVAAAISVTPLGQDWVSQVVDELDSLGSSIGGLFS